MRKGGVAALTAPFPAAQGQQVRTVRARDLQGHGRYERADAACPLLAAPAGKSLLEELAELAVGIWEVASGRVAVVGGDDQPPPGGKALDEGPEGLAGQLLSHVLRQRLQPLPCAGTIVQLGVGPV